jgi:hypothetical protein
MRPPSYGPALDALTSALAEADRDRERLDGNVRIYAQTLAEYVAGQTEAATRAQSIRAAIDALTAAGAS